MRTKVIISFISVIALSVFLPLSVFAQTTPATNYDSSYSQGAADNQNIQWNASSTNSSLPSGSIYNQWINTQAQSANTSAKDAANASNNTINKDIFNPNQSYTDVNTGLYNAGKATNQSAVSQAATCKVSIKTFRDIFIVATCVINNFLITIAISFASLYFTWGVVQYVLSADSVEERKKSKQIMLWGVLALFVMLSVWGIVGAMRMLFGI